MGTVRFLLCVLWVVGFGRGWVFNGDFVGYGVYGKEKEIASGRKAPRNDVGAVERDREVAAERLIAAARKDLGVREEGCGNCGRRVEEYLAYVGFKKGAPWCAAAVSYWFRLAGFSAPRTAWSPAMFPEGRVVGIASEAAHSRNDAGAAERGRNRAEDGRLNPSLREGTTNQAKGELSAANQSQVKGLVLGIYFPSLKRIGHVGLVEGLRGDFVSSIEGNTSCGDCRVAAHPRNDEGVYPRNDAGAAERGRNRGNGDREGEGVYRRMRHRRTICKYADWLHPAKH